MKLLTGVIVLTCIPFLLTVLSASIEESRLKEKNFIRCFFFELFEDLGLVLSAIFHKPKHFGGMLKHLQQIGLYLTEVFGICGLLLLFVNHLSPVNPADSHLFWYQQIMRFLSLYTAYQLFVFVLLNLSASSDYDSWSAVNRLLKTYLVYLDTTDFMEESQIRYELDKGIENCLNPYTMMNPKAKEQVEQINTFLNMNKESLLRDGVKNRVKLMQTKAEHEMQKASFFWNFSLLLRFVKTS